MPTLVRSYVRTCVVTIQFKEKPGLTWYTDVLSKQVWIRRRKYSAPMVPMESASSIDVHIHACGCVTVWVIVMRSIWVQSPGMRSAQISAGKYGIPYPRDFHACIRKRFIRRVARAMLAARLVERFNNGSKTNFPRKHFSAVSALMWMVSTGRKEIYQSWPPLKTQKTHNARFSETRPR